MWRGHSNVNIKVIHAGRSIAGGAIAMLILKLFMQVSLYLEGP
jgi:hypothetical protein